MFYFPGNFSEDLAQILPMDLSPYQYLLTFGEGLKFKTEIIRMYSTFRVFSQSSKISERYSQSELSTLSSETGLDYFPDDHQQQLLNMILDEIDEFEKQKIEYEAEDLVEYIGKGICHLLHKYMNGLVFFYSCIEKDEIISKIQKQIHEVNIKLHRIKIHLKSLNIIDLKESEKRTKYVNDKFGKYKPQDPYKGLNFILGSSIKTLLKNIEMLMNGCGQAHTFEKYELVLKSTTLQSLQVAAKLLKCEYSYRTLMNLNNQISKKKNKSRAYDVIAEPLIRYKNLKKSFLENCKKNWFYNVLQSKMENQNQWSLISYLVNALDNVNLNCTSYNSLWFDKSSLQLIVFLSNTMYW